MLHRVVRRGVAAAGAGRRAGAVAVRLCSISVVHRGREPADSSVLCIPLYSSPKKARSAEFLEGQVEATFSSPAHTDAAGTIKAQLREVLQRGLFDGSAGARFTFTCSKSSEGGEARPTVVTLTGLGSHPKPPQDYFAIGRSIGALAAQCRASPEAPPTATPLTAVDVLLPPPLLAALSADLPAGEAVRQLLLGAEEAGYEDTRFRGRPDKRSHRDKDTSKCSIALLNLPNDCIMPAEAEELTVPTDAVAHRRLAEWSRRAAAEAEGVQWARDQVNAPPNMKRPGVFAASCHAFASELGLQCTLLDGDQCKDRGMGAFLGVAQGSQDRPCLVHLTYTPPAADLTDANSVAATSTPRNRVIALVGKGLTFDSGGYNLKVGASQIELMKMDMGGAAAVFGAATAIAKLQPQGVEVHFISAVCENMVSDRAMRPGDVLTASNGKTIEVINTDAEGRLTLADALVYASNLKGKGPCTGPDVIVDLATLTGACIVGLGDRVAALYTDSDELAAGLTRAAERSAEKVWRMPLEAEYTAQITGGVCDLKNLGTDGRGGGSITAALFLKEFVGREARCVQHADADDAEEHVQWAHIDMAGPVWDGKGGQATGWGVKTLTQFVLDQGALGTK